MLYIISRLDLHTAAYRTRGFVGGVIFFCYNDYRTHVGDRGVGVLKQRVHGVVDVYEQRDVSIPDVAPGAAVKVAVGFTQTGAPVRVQFDVRRPTRISTYTLNWKP